MPAFSAHDQFGKQVYRKLAPEICAVIKTDTRLFRLGFQGPDVLFYYRPLQKNEISSLGVRLHCQSGGALFSRLCEQLRQREDRAMLSYMLGVCCHYTLDRACHPYVNGWAKDDGSAHQWLETNFDFYIRKKYGIEHRRYLGLPKKVNNAVLAQVYGISEKQAAECVRSFRWFESILDLQKPVKMAEHLLKKEGKFSSLTLPKENMLPRETQELYHLYEGAVMQAVQLLEHVYQGAQTAQVQWDDFEENFEGIKA